MSISLRQAAAGVSFIGFLATGCQPDGTVSDLLPEVTAGSAPTACVAGFDPNVSISATLDQRGWSSAERFLRIAAFPTSDGTTEAQARQKLESVEAQEVTNFDCTPVEGSDTAQQCSFSFPHLGTLEAGRQEATLIPGRTIFFEWAIEYSLPEGNDKAYVRSDIGSLSVCGTCSSNADCAGGATCQRDPFAPAAVEQCAEIFGVELPIFCDDDGGLAPMICLP